jgi:hypothetical protein
MQLTKVSAHEIRCAFAFRIVFGGENGHDMRSQILDLGDVRRLNEMMRGARVHFAEDVRFRIDPLEKEETLCSHA